MNHKVLLADDSLTIQKVIKITLANQPYEVTEASSEEELFRHLPEIKPKLVFLDFNLSEKYTGYELTARIKSIVPSAKVLLLLGTFDSVEDASMEKCGASDKIVKPFDSNKFIAICKQLIDSFGPEEIPYPQPKSSSSTGLHSDLDDQWTVNQPVVPKEEPNSEPKISAAPNALHKEMFDWGMSIPGVINDAGADELLDLPPIIGEVKSLAEHRDQRASTLVTKDEQKYPVADDLDYPTVEEHLLGTGGSSPNPSSKFISIESFNDHLDLEIQGAYVPEETDIDNLEAQIMDEVGDDLWKIDEFEDMKKDIAAKVEEAKSTFKPSLNDFDESLFKPVDDAASTDWSENDSSPQVKEPILSEPSRSQPDLSQLRGEMEEMVKKYVRQYMDEVFKQSSEKVAWEVIPDLAENLIRQELSKLSSKIINND